MNNYVPPPPAPIARSVKCSAAQEYLLRRLGHALVLQWDALSDDMQDLLIDQAALVEDREEAPHEPNDIENFIRKAKTTPVAKAQPQGDDAP